MRLLFTLLFLTSNSFSKESHFNDIWSRPDWSVDARLKNNNPRKNIYKLSSEELKKVENAGKLHALVYPVDVSGIFLPTGPLKKFLKMNLKKSLTAKALFMNID